MEETFDIHLFNISDNLVLIYCGQALIPLSKYIKTWTILVFVAVNHENDTCFENGLVMGYADCKCCVGLVETPKTVLTLIQLCGVRTDHAVMEIVIILEWKVIDKSPLA